MCHQLIAFLCGGVKADRIVHLIICAVRNLYICLLYTSVLEVRDIIRNYSKNTFPSVGRSKSPRTLKSVDFPQPDFPIICLLYTSCHGCIYCTTKPEVWTSVSLFSSPDFLFFYLFLSQSKKYCSYDRSDHQSYQIHQSMFHKREYKDYTVRSHQCTSKCHGKCSCCRCTYDAGRKNMKRI